MFEGTDYSDDSDYSVEKTKHHEKKKNRKKEKEEDDIRLTALRKSR